MSSAGPASLQCNPSGRAGFLLRPDLTKLPGWHMSTRSPQTQRPGRAAWESMGWSGGSQTFSWGFSWLHGGVCTPTLWPGGGGGLEGISGAQPELPAVMPGNVLSPSWRSLLASFNKTQIPKTNPTFQKRTRKKSEKAPQRKNKYHQRNISKHTAKHTKSKL